MAKITSLPQDLPILNQALADLGALKQQVAALENGLTMQPFDPKMTSGGGPYTNASARGYWTQLGSLVFITLDMHFTTIGGGSSTIITLPKACDTSAGNYVLSGVEIAVDGSAWIGQIGFANNQSICVFRKYDGSGTPPTGARIVATGFYPTL